MTSPTSYRSLGMAISRGVIETAKKVVIYGPEGIGKSTLASKFPTPLFLDVEGSTKSMNVDRLDGLTSWQGLLSAVAAVLNASERLEYRTIVIDTADWAEKLATAYVCAQQKKSGIEEFGYGKGYVYLKEAFSELLEDCDRLIAAGINVVFTAHAMMRKFEQPDERGAYDRWEMKLTKHDAPMLKEWADIVLFCNYKTYSQKQENGSYKATGGQRVMYAAHNPCWDAKNRYGLADELPMDYSAIAAVIERAPEKPAEPKQDIESRPSADDSPPVPALVCAACGEPIEGIGKWSAQQIADRSMELFGECLCVSCAKSRSSQKSA